MKITVCELPNRTDMLEETWAQLIEHTASSCSDLLLLPEMPFFPWLPLTREPDLIRWDAAVKAHDEWIERLSELSSAAVLGSRPVNREGRRLNEGFVWESAGGYRSAHTKYYLPDEEGFWEASWYERSRCSFDVTETCGIKIGFQICTDMWFMEHSRDLGRQGAQVIAIPRATPRSTLDKWLAGGRTVAVVSGAFTISSNRLSRLEEAADLGGLGWIADPDGTVVATTSSDQPFVTIDVQLNLADRAKHTYPRYVQD